MKPSHLKGVQTHNRGPLFHITGVPSSGSWTAIGQGNGWINAGLNNSSGMHDHPVNHDDQANEAIELFVLAKSVLPFTDDRTISSTRLGAKLIGTSASDIIMFSGKGQSAKGKTGKDMFALDLDMLATTEERRLDKIKDVDFGEGDNIILASATMKLKGIRLGISRSKKEYKSLLGSEADLIFKINRKRTKGVLSANTSFHDHGIDSRDTLLKVKGDLGYNDVLPLEMARLS